MSAGALASARGSVVGFLPCTLWAEGKGHDPLLGSGDLAHEWAQRGGGRGLPLRVCAARRA
jgi:hypothetical protein